MDLARGASCSLPKPLALFMKHKLALNKANEVFEILPLIIFVDHAGGKQTRSTPSTTVLIWSLTNNVASCTINTIFATLPCYLCLGVSARL